MVTPSIKRPAIKNWTRKPIREPNEMIELTERNGGYLAVIVATNDRASGTKRPGTLHCLSWVLFEII